MTAPSRFITITEFINDDAPHLKDKQTGTVHLGCFLWILCFYLLRKQRGKEFLEKLTEPFDAIYRHCNLSGMGPKKKRNIQLTSAELKKLVADEVKNQRKKQRSETSSEDEEEEEEKEKKKSDRKSKSKAKSKKKKHATSSVSSRDGDSSSSSGASEGVDDELVEMWRPDKWSDKEAEMVQRMQVVLPGKSRNEHQQGEFDFMRKLLKALLEESSDRAVKHAKNLFGRRMIVLATKQEFSHRSKDVEAHMSAVMTSSIATWSKARQAAKKKFQAKQHVQGSFRGRGNGRGNFRGGRGA